MSEVAQLPKEGLVRLEELVGGPVRVVPLSRRSIYRLMARGEFPPPRKLGRRTVWAVEDIRSWLATFTSGRGVSSPVAESGSQ